MRIIIAPAKQMREEDNPFETGMPVFAERTRELLSYLRSLSYPELKKLWNCTDKIAEQNYFRINDMELSSAYTPAILAYDGIAYKYMAPNVFEYGEFDYVQEHLRILSGFYGVLKPMDAVKPYRLEMQAKAQPMGCQDLYSFWGELLYNEVIDKSGIIINLASKEYSRCIEAFVKPEDRFISCFFAELENGKPVQKGVYAKMARGEMVRYMAEKHIEEPEEMKSFDRLGYAFDEKRSNESSYVFIKNGKGTKAEHE